MSASLVNTSSTTRTPTDSGALQGGAAAPSGTIDLVFANDRYDYVVTLRDPARCKSARELFHALEGLGDRHRHGTCDDPRYMDALLRFTDILAKAPDPSLDLARCGLLLESLCWPHELKNARCKEAIVDKLLSNPREEVRSVAIDALHEVYGSRIQRLPSELQAALVNALNRSTRDSDSAKIVNMLAFAEVEQDAIISAGLQDAFPLTRKEAVKHLREVGDDPRIEKLMGRELAECGPNPDFATGIAGGYILAKRPTATTTKRLMQLGLKVVENHHGGDPFSKQGSTFFDGLVYDNSPRGMAIALRCLEGNFRYDIGTRTHRSLAYLLHLGAEALRQDQEVRSVRDVMFYVEGLLPEAILRKALHVLARSKDPGAMRLLQRQRSSSWSSPTRKALIDEAVA